jgi:hypothetical protein
MKNNAIGVSTIDDQGLSQRLIQFSITLGWGVSPVKVIKVCDRQFDESRAHLFKMDEDSGLYVLCYHPNLDKHVVAKKLYRKAILPELLNFRKKLAERDAAALEEIMSSQSQPMSQGAEVAAGADDQLTAAEQKFGLMALHSDGEHFNLDVIVDDLIPYVKENDFNVVFCKFAGGASMTSSPNDIGLGIHPPMHKYFHSSSFKYEDGDSPFPAGRKWEDLKSFLCKTLATKDFKTIWKALKHSPGVLNKALTQENIKSAFQHSGIITSEGVRRVQNGETKNPSDPVTMLSKCPHFAELTTEVAKKTAKKTVRALGKECFALRGMATEGTSRAPYNHFCFTGIISGPADNCSFVAFDNSLRAFR